MIADLRVVLRLAFISSLIQGVRHSCAQKLDLFPQFVTLVCGAEERVYFFCRWVRPVAVLPLPHLARPLDQFLVSHTASQIFGPRLPGARRLIETS